MLIWSGAGGGGGARLAEAAHELGFEGKRRLRRLQPAGNAERARRRAGVGGRGRRGRDRSRSHPAAGRVRGRGGRLRQRAVARRAGGRGRRHRHVPRARGGLGRRRPAGHGDARARRDADEPRGPPAAPAPGGGAAGAGRARVDREARGALRRRAVPARLDPVRRGRAAHVRRASTCRRSASRRLCPARAPWIAPDAGAAGDGGGSSGRPGPTSTSLGELRLLRYRPLFSGPQVERVRELQFQRPAAGGRAVGARRGAPRYRHRRHGHASLERHLRRASRAGRPARSSPASSASPTSTRATCTRSSRWSRRDALSSPATTEAWWISLIKCFVVINLVMVTFAYLTLAERKVMGRMQLRYGPNRVGPEGPAAADRRPPQAAQQGELPPGRLGRRALHRVPVPGGVHRARHVLGHPVGPGLDDRRPDGDRLRRRRPDRARVHVRDRVARRVRVHRRRLVVRLEVLAPRLDAHLRPARLLRGVAGAVGARRGDHGRLALADADRRRPGGRGLVRAAAVRRLPRLLPRRAWPRRRARRSTCPRPSRSSSPATTPSTAACASACSRWPSTST